MKKINLYEQLPRIILSIIIGGLLVAFPDVFQNTIIYLIGGIITLIGVIKLIMYFRNNIKTNTSLVPINAIIYLIVGVIVILKAELFLSVLMLSLGFILIVMGLGQILMYIGLRKVAVVPLSMYIFPTVLLLAGIVSIYNPFQVTMTLITFFGYVMLFYAISELVYMYIAKHNKI